MNSRLFKNYTYMLFSVSSEDVIRKKLLNLYEKPVINTPEGDFACPVCNKPYKSETKVKDHMAKKDCWDYRNVFEGTFFENKVYKLYKEIEITFKRTPVTLKKFMKSKTSENYFELLSMSFVYDTDMAEMMEYFFVTYTRITIKTMIKKFVLPSEREKFTKYKQKNRSLERSDAFYQKNRSNFFSSQNNGFIKSLLNGDMSMTYVRENIPKTDMLVIMQHIGPMGIEFFKDYISENL